LFSRRRKPDDPNRDDRVAVRALSAAIALVRVRDLGLARRREHGAIGRETRFRVPCGLSFGLLAFGRVEPVLPRKLRPGDQIRVIAPSLSRAFVMAHDHSALIEERFHTLELEVFFGEHVDEHDAFQSSPRESRIADLHAAFRDPNVAGILTVIGGFNSNELLADVDWELVAANPKVFCGFSDITALQNAMLARSRLVTYSGPHWSTFGMRRPFRADAHVISRCPVR
jgi:LD-carboxypeptidase N-terminal domain